MHSTRRIALAALTGALTALVPASTATAIGGSGSTSFQHGTGGQAYTGIISGNAIGSAVFSTSIGNVTCSQAPISGNITDAGSPGNDALGNVTASDFEESSSEACPDTLSRAVGGPTHEDFVSQVPWGASFTWLDDNTTGTPNGLALLSNVSILVDLDTSNCVYMGDHNNVAGSLLGNVYNPDNNPSGHLVIDLVSQPLETFDGGGCSAVPTGSLTVKWQLVGAPGAGELFVREQLPAAPPAQVGGGAEGAAQGQPAVATKCKKKKKKPKRKSAGTAKKKKKGCKKKKKRK